MAVHIHTHYAFTGQIEILLRSGGALDCVQKKVDPHSGAHETIFPDEANRPKTEVESRPSSPLDSVGAASNPPQIRSASLSEKPVTYSCNP